MRKILVIALVMAVLGLALPALAGGRPFTVEMTGAAERPSPGDANASGTAHITLNQGQGEVCFDITVAGLDTPIVGAHIHRAPTTAAGPVVVPFEVDLNGCVAADAGLIKEIRQNPGDFYVNVHTADFPAGAVRAQLSK